jgi:hypothetical protein
MQKEKRVRDSGINDESVKNMLLGHAEACMQLADKIGKGGERLKEYEKQLVRSAMLPAVKESMEIIQSNYMTGNVDWVEQETKRLHDLLTFPR